MNFLCMQQGVLCKNSDLNGECVLLHCDRYIDMIDKIDFAKGNISVSKYEYYSKLPGWECPVCHSGLSPDQKTCSYCSDKQKRTVIARKGKFALCVKENAQTTHDLEIREYDDTDYQIIASIDNKEVVFIGGRFTEIIESLPVNSTELNDFKIIMNIAQLIAVNTEKIKF